MLRVIAGKYKNRKLDHPSLEVTRPTMDRTKEGVFSMFQFDIKGKLFLDLFAGSGSVAIEAVSRGAMKSICIDSSMKAVEVIEKNMEKLGIRNIDVYKKDAIKYVQSKKGVNFDYIYLDPPFEDTVLLNATLQAIVDNRIMSPESYIIVETSHPRDVVLPKGLVERKTKKYGKTHILVLTNNI